MVILKGGDFYTNRCKTNYVNSNKKTRGVRRLTTSKISQKDFNVWTFA